MPHGKKTAPSHLVLARGGLPGHCPNKRVTQLLSGITLQRENDPHIRTTTHQPKQPNVPTAAQRQPRAQTGPSCAGPVLPVPGWPPGVPPDPAMLVAVKECSPRRRLHPALGQVPGRGCPLSHTGMVQGLQDEVPTTKTQQQLLSKHLPAIRVLCTQTFFWGSVCPAVLDRGEPGTGGQGWATAEASPRGNLAVSSSRLRPVPGQLRVTATAPPGNAPRDARPPPAPQAEHPHMGLPGCPHTVGLSVTHTQVTLSGACGRTVAKTRTNPGIRGWEHSHQPPEPVTATETGAGEPWGLRAQPLSPPCHAPTCTALGTPDPVPEAPPCS